MAEQKKKEEWVKYLIVHRVEVVRYHGITEQRAAQGFSAG
jgi:hypothetical protein